MANGVNGEAMSLAVYPGFICIKYSLKKETFNYPKLLDPIYRRNHSNNLNFQTAFHGLINKSKRLKNVKCGKQMRKI